MISTRTLTHWLCLFTAVTLQATTVTSDPSANVVVDTRNFTSLSTDAITMHRVTADVLENAGNGPNVDEPLRVKGTNRNKLAAQPMIQGQFDPPWLVLGDAFGGLVADGVTPLLFKVNLEGIVPVGGSGYEVSLKSKGNGRYFDGVNTTPPIRVLNGTVFNSLPAFAATPQEPVAFVLIPPVNPDHIFATEVLEEYYAPVIMDLEVRQLGVPNKVLAKYRFGIRKPPLVLVHGYNSDENAWSSTFRNAVDHGRAPEFLVRVGYGTAHKSHENIHGALLPLAATLSKELRNQVEKSAALSQWAWTRYDAVGHSQGGVLLRMLCSQSQLAGGANISTLGLPAFRNADNQYRGRFRRVVTVGSPHAGSTLAEMGFGLRNAGVPFRVRFEKGLLNVDDDLPAKLDAMVKKLLQPKFRVGNDSALDVINNLLLCDPLARLHLLQTTIYGGCAPGTNGQDYGTTQYLFYSSLYLDLPTPTVPNPATNQDEVPGVVVAPNGADGVVDSKSQTAGGGSNKSSAIAEQNYNIAHSTFGDRDTESPVVAAKVRDLLNGTASQFGSVTIPQNLRNFMEDRRVRIGLLADAIADGQTAVAAACFLPTAPSPSALGSSKKSMRGVTQLLGDQTFQFALQPPPGESPNGLVEWSVAVFGPAGSNAAPTIATAGTFGELLTLTISESLLGQVVLSVRFPSTTGTTVIGTEQIVFDRPPGNVLTGIALDPGSIQSQIGAEVALTVSGTYDGTISSRLFTNAANTTFQSSNAGVATVDADGRVKLLALGTATITATYNGMLVATSPVTVLDVVPVVTSAASVSGTVGQAFSHQLTASQAVESFATAPLPPGLTLNVQTGLISGTPTGQGLTSALVAVTNANGTGSKQVDFVISGLPGAPTDLGLNASGVSEQKPIGTLVGRFATVDPNPLDTFMYQLVTGTGSTDNASFTITGDQLFTAAVLNRATQSTVSIRLRTTDSSAASLEKAIVLPVMAPPAIAQQPEPQRVFTGDRALFSVKASGLEPLRYQWKMNGVDIPGEDGRIFEIATANPSHAGNYTVTVTNGDGSATSTTVSLIVDPTSYEKWLSQVPNATGGPVYEPHGDYNQDGVQNFLDFAFGVPPGTASALGAQPFITQDATSPVFIYYAANGIEPLTYRIIKSADLAAWQEHIPTPSDVTTINHGGYTEVQVRVPWADPKMFLKLEVSTE